MKTVKFRGDSVHTLMRQVKSEYGDNVLLLSTKQDAPEVVEIEVGLLEDTDELETSAEQSDIEPQLDLLADVFKESNVFVGLPLHGIQDELLKVLKRTSRAKTWSTETTAKALSKIVKCDPYISENARFVALLGAKNSGRTTTIIKLASRLQAALGLQIGIIAGDPEDEQGAFHLCAMGKILNIPVTGFDFEVPARERLAEAADRLGDCDLIFVDTPELSSLGVKGRREIENVLGTGGHIEKILMIAATHSEEEMVALIRNGVALGCSKGVLSFLDKAGQIGNAIQALWKTALPLSFVCMGERVPEDIEPASTRRLAWYLSRLVH
jgi:flagellar biosynthesis protein FlhF